VHSEAVSNDPPKIHSNRFRAHRGFTLVEALIGLVLTALVISAGAAMINAFSISSRALPVQGARQVSDARVQAMIAELRSAVAISQISPTQVTAIINTAGNTVNKPTVNGVPTGQYSVSFYF